MICRHCKEEFEPQPGKPGFINECPGCVGQDVPLLMAKVAWSGKHTMELEITSDRKAAKAFNNAQRRSSAGPMSCFGQSASRTANTILGESTVLAELRDDRQAHEELIDQKIESTEHRWKPNSTKA